MSRSKNLRRRQFVLLAGTAASGALVSCGGAKSPWRFLSAQEGALLEAICEQIIPTDEDPGAAWAGAVNFIDRQLGGHYRKLRKTYHEGLQHFEASCRASQGKSFLELDAAQQTAFLEKLQGEDLTFFRMLIDHTMQSYYGDPRHGGNREFVSWRMLGLPISPIRGRALYDLTKS